MNKALRDYLQEESRRASELIEQVSRRLENSPEGYLQIFKHHSNFQYYHWLPEGRRYIGKKNPELAIKLAQKEYNILLIKAAKELQEQLDMMEKILDENDYVEIISRFPAEKRKLISPYFLTDAEFAKKWEEVAFEPKMIDESVPEIFTNKGERVRSKTEKIIADMLAGLGIPYRYEAPLLLNGFGTVYPDFTMLKMVSRENIYWEHFGMMDDEAYCEKAIKKSNCYIRNGYIPGKNLLLTYESKNCPINMRNVENQLYAILDL